MSNITLIGLGTMGSALAKALLNGGHATTVWNRTQSAIDRAVSMGATGAANFFEAIDASVKTWEGCIKLIQDHAILRDLNSKIPDFYSDLFNRAMKSGYGEEDVASVVKVLREKAGV